MLGNWNASCHASPTALAPKMRDSIMSRAKPNIRLISVIPPIIPVDFSRFMRRPPVCQHCLIRLRLPVVLRRLPVPAPVAGHTGR